MRTSVILFLLAIGSAQGDSRPILHGGPVDARDSISAADLTRIEAAVADYEARLRKGLAPRAEAPRPYPFFPQAGTIGHDLFLFNAVDLDSTPAIQDFDCSEYTYNGHQGHDVDLIGFLQQEVGVPIFAALDGTVVDTRDGEPDMNTQASSAPSNFVILDHGGTHYTWYLHMKKGSVAVVKNQTVTAGTQLGLTASSGNSTGPHLHFESRLNGQHFEPSAGPCRSGSSNWASQPPIKRETYPREFSFSSASYAGYAGYPWDEAPRTGSYVRGMRSVYFKAVIANLEPRSSYSFRIHRPDGSTAAQYSETFNNRSLFRYSWWWWAWQLTLEPPGRWTLQLDVNGKRLVTAPFDVVASSADLTNRPPNPIGLTIEPSAPSPNDVAFCRVATSLVSEDPDYDLVRYRFQWIIGERIVREVTSAALSDALAKGIARAGDRVTCRVTPSDGRVDGTPASASATYSGGSGRRRAVRR